MCVFRAQHHGEVYLDKTAEELLIGAAEASCSLWHEELSTPGVPCLLGFLGDRGLKTHSPTSGEDRLPALPRLTSSPLVGFAVCQGPHLGRSGWRGPCRDTWGLRLGLVWPGPDSPIRELSRPFQSLL